MIDHFHFALRRIILDAVGRSAKSATHHPLLAANSIFNDRFLRHRIQCLSAHRLSR
ncbi:MAG: hypothetical protein ACJAU9_000820 [Lentimonas sp.]|jgi:hypothetical protein